MEVGEDLAPEILIRQYSSNDTSGVVPLVIQYRGYFCKRTRRGMSIDEIRKRTRDISTDVRRPPWSFSR
jgi:hypothetical protein